MKSHSTELKHLLLAFGEVLAASRDQQEVLRTQLRELQLSLEELDGFAGEMAAILAELKGKA